MPEGPWMEQTSSGKRQRPQEDLRRLLRRLRRVAVSIANNRNANVLEVVNRQPRQHVRVDLIVPELLLVLAEPKTAKPPADIHRRASHGWKDDRSAAAASPLAPIGALGVKSFSNSDLTNRQRTVLSLCKAQAADLFVFGTV